MATTIPTPEPTGGPSELVDAIIDVVEEVQRRVLARIEALEHAMKHDAARLSARVDDLETRALGMAFAGVWNPIDTYRRGDLVQRSSALWLALTTSAGVAPGSDATSWRLILKRPNKTHHTEAGS